MRYAHSLKFGFLFTLGFSLEASSGYMQNSTSESPISLDVPSGLVLFTVQNETDGISLTVTPTCPPAALECTVPQSHRIPNVSLPDECNSGNCNDILVISDEAELSNPVQYILVVPVVRGVTLLHFVYRLDTQHLEFKEQSVVDSNRFSCNPTSSAHLGKAYYTLCTDSSSGNLKVLVLENVRNISGAVFSASVVDARIPINSTLTDITWIDLSSYDTEHPYKLLFGIETDLYQFDLELSLSRTISFPGCTGVITQIQPTPELVQNAYYVLIYCQANYGYADIDNADENYVSDVDNYESGYPIVCPGVSSLLNITTNGTQSILHYNAKATPLIGEAILLDESLCFGTDKKLFYLYTDLELGVFVLDLENEKINNISMNTCPTDSCSLLRVFDQRYILLEERNPASLDLNSKLKLFDVFQKEVVSVINVNYTSDIMLVLKFPPTPQSALTIGISVTVAIVALLLLLLFIVIGCIR